MPARMSASYPRLVAFSKVFATFMEFMVVFFELPKFYPIFLAMFENDYHILPFLPGPKSESNPIWIAAHLLVALLLVLLLVKSVKFPNTFQHAHKMLFEVLFASSILLVMLNCYHLGDASALQAATINVGLLLVLAIIFHSTHEENAPVMRFAFLVIFTIPVWLNLVGFCFAVRGTSMSLISNPQDEWKLYSLLFTTPSYETGELVSNARKNLHTLIICGFISSLAYYGSRYVFGNDNESLNTSQKQESEKTD